MGIDVAHRAYHESRLREKAAARELRNMERGERIVIGTRQGWLKRLGSKLGEMPAGANDNLQVSEYAEVRIVRVQRLYGLSGYAAVQWIKEHYFNHNPERFIQDAQDFFDFRAHMTQNEGGISPEVFEHCLNATPESVLVDATKWAAANRAQQPAVQL